MTKKAETAHPIHELLVSRWSPYGFSDKPVSKEDLASLFEAARWAASSYNEQPWRFILGTKEDAEQYEKVLSCLVEPNQVWAKHAPVLVLAGVKLNFERNGKENTAAEHDLGLAVANLSIEATQRGLAVHQMIGILPDKAREVFLVPEDAKIHTALAIGYAAPAASHLPEGMGERDTSPRSRRELSELVYKGNWDDGGFW